MRKKQNDRATNPKADPRLAGTQKQRNMQKEPSVRAGAGGRKQRSGGNRGKKA